MLSRTTYALIKKKPIAAVAVGVLLLFLMVSLLGQPFLPDNTPSANRQLSEAPLLKAGESLTVLMVSTQNTEERWVPISEYSWNGDQLMASVIINPGGETVSTQFHREEVIGIEKKTFWLGTDNLGRDLLSRLIVGIKISLLIGFFAVVVSCIIGVVMGILAGYFGGWVDMIIMTFINSVWSIPTILLVFALVLAIGRGVENIVLAIGLTMWIDIARLIRGMTKSLRQKEYVLATQALSFSDKRIIWRHIFPNMIDPLVVLATANFATAILVEAGISYLGFGIQPPNPSIGILLSENYAYVLGGHYVKALAPAVVIVILVLALNLIGTALRDIWSVDLKTHEA